VVGTFEAPVGGAAAGAVAGAAVGDFAGAAAEEVAAGAAVAGASVDFADFLERLFLGAALSVLAAAEAGAAGAEASVEAVPFFERDFLGVPEPSAASAFFDVLFFLEDAVPELDAACEPEASASVFFFFLLFLAASASLWLLSAGGGGVCDQPKILPARSNKAANKVMYILLAVFILKLSLRPWRLIYPADHTHKSAAGWEQAAFQLRVAGLPRRNGRVMSKNESEVKKEENMSGPMEEWR